MSSFQDKVEDLAGVTVSDTAALSDFLTASARAVTDILPKEAFIHNATIDETTADGEGYDAENKRVIYVARNGRVSNEVPFGLAVQIASNGSLFKATERSPFHYYKGKTIVSKPDPTSNHKGQIIAFAYPTVAYDGTGIPSFPDNAEYAVTLGATCNFIMSLISAERVAIPSTLGALTITSNAPTAPTAPNFTYSDVSVSDIIKPFVSVSDMASMTVSAPSYSKPVLALGTTPTIGNLTIGSTPPTTPALSSNSVSFSTTAPIYTKPAQTYDIVQFETFLETNEDSELAQVQMNRLAQELSEYQANIQNELNAFNKLNTEYQAQLQKSIQNAQLASQDDAQALQKYSNEIQVYSTNINKEVQEYTQNLEGDLRVWQAERTTDIQKYSSDIQNELNEFNKENVEYQQDIGRKVQNLQKDVKIAVDNAQNDMAVNKTNLDKNVQIELQNAINNFQEEVKEYDSSIQKYNGELNAYQNNVGKEVQEHQANVQKQATNLQRHQALIQTLNTQYQMCEGKYQQELSRLGGTRDGRQN